MALLYFLRSQNYSNQKYNINKHFLNFNLPTKTILESFIQLKLVIIALILLSLVEISAQIYCNSTYIFFMFIFPYVLKLINSTKELIQL